MVRRVVRGRTSRHHHPQPIELDSEPLHSPTQRHVRPARRLSVSSTTPTSPTTAKLSPLSSPTSPSRSSQKKQYSFIPLPGQVRKRPRRRYDEIERHYVCSWPGCTKAYGTLNHLNAHVVMQGHGQRRVPSEFKELRKQWRKQKKEEAVAAAAHQTSSVPDHAPSLSSAYPVPPLHHRVSLPSLPHTILQSHDSPMSGGYHHSHHHQIRTPQHANTFPPPSLSHHHHPHHQHSHPHPHSAYSLPMGPPPSSSSTGGGYNPYGGAVPGASSSVDELDLRYPSSSDMHHSSHHQQQQGGGRTPGSVSDRLHPAWGAESLSSGGLTGRFASVSGPGSSSGLGGNRLPPDSILSTPLPGYEPSTYEENGSGEEYDRY
ncbi:hypothetical protein JAAARDRAFT_507453 [Jaapia argillacea MUCL 33604]|uniref:C2H2-type domain-containing protein n=1 Tax=Jaapia argillacea MUCL 33604 TaxID=933084 RepID=A0A067Q5F0_9AGAM|nr:hypothetical protein JAAARDRAFT_507453 [Jaapia argillacea MUCL 33604]